MNISFYSYKGGVGRTLLCANTAAYLCYYQEMKILLWDWDFEAPGLHSYFNIEDENINKGTLEFLEDYMRKMRGNEKVGVKDLDFIEKDDIISIPTQGKGKIDLIPAGNYSNNYASRLIDFQWFEFLAGYDGAVYIDLLKQRIKKLDYDFVFIDARTGIGDYAGICNVLLPDINVFVIGPNKQNIIGNKLMIERILRHPYVTSIKKNPVIVPIFSRLDEQDMQKLQFWIKEFKDVFSSFIPRLMPDDDPSEEEASKYVREFLDETCLPYTPMLALGENVLFNERKEEVFSFGFKQRYVNIANCFCDLKRFGFAKLQAEYINPVVNVTDNFNDAYREGQLYLETAKNENISNTESLELYEKAKLTFIKLLKENQTSFELYKGLTESYIGLRQFKDALSVLQKINVSSDEVWVLRARCLIELKRDNEVDFSRLKRFDLAIPMLSQLVTSTANLFYEDGDQGKALEIIETFNKKVHKEANIESRNI